MGLPYSRVGNTFILKRESSPLHAPRDLEICALIKGGGNHRETGGQRTRDHQSKEAFVGSTTMPAWEHVREKRTNHFMAQKKKIIIVHDRRGRNAQKKRGETAKGGELTISACRPGLAKGGGRPKKRNASHRPTAIVQEQLNPVLKMGNRKTNKRREKNRTHPRGEVRADEAHTNGWN